MKSHSSSLGRPAFFAALVVFSGAGCEPGVDSGAQLSASGMGVPIPVDADTGVTGVDGISRADAEVIAERWMERQAEIEQDPTLDEAQVGVPVLFNALDGEPMFYEFPVTVDDEPRGFVNVAARFGLGGVVLSASFDGPTWAQTLEEQVAARHGDVAFRYVGVRPPVRVAVVPGWARTGGELDDAIDVSTFCHPAD